jgi:hypothetical protein
VFGKLSFVVSGHHSPVARPHRRPGMRAGVATKMVSLVPSRPAPESFGLISSVGAASVPDLSSQNQSRTAAFSMKSEVQTRINRERPFSGRTGDAAEIGGIDIRYRIAPLRHIQQVDGISPDGEALGFIELDSFTQRHV